MSALGKIGSLDIAAANAPALLATVDEAAIVNILACNRTSADATIRIAISPTGSSAPAAADWIEYDVVVAAYQPMERTGLALSNGEKIFVQSSTLGFSFRAHGVPAT
jgi:hypothetical protein